MRRYLLAICVLLFVALPALAHEHRHVGAYELTFGWRNEPAYAGMMNGPELSIVIVSEEGEHGQEADSEATEAEGDEHEHAEEAVPLDMSTVEVNLQAEVTFGDQSTTVFFRPAFGETGHYIAELMPMLPGDYSFHITGTIGDQAIDEVFTSADGNFSTIEPPTDVMFPTLPMVDNARLEALEARIVELEAQLAALQNS